MTDKSPASGDDQIAAIHTAAVARGEEYYIDPLSGLLVMTELHHLDRGECCERGCRHCPYRT